MKKSKLFLQSVILYIICNAILYVGFSMGNKTFNFYKWEETPAWIYVTILIFLSLGFLIYLIETFFKPGKDSTNE